MPISPKLILVRYRRPTNLSQPRLAADFLSLRERTKVRVISWRSLTRFARNLSRRPQRFLWIGGVENRVENAFEVLIYLAVEKPDDPNALFVKVDFTIQIGGLSKVACMPGAIEFNSEVSFGAEEVDDSVADGNLPAEFQTTQLPVS
jgi:hypothetical protein